MDWFIFGFASLCAAYTHYYALISVAFFYLMLLPLLRRGKEYTKRILLLYGLTVLSYIFWLYVLLKTFKRTNGSWWMTSIATFSECFDFVWGYKWLSVFAFVLFVAVTVLALKYLFRRIRFPMRPFYFLPVFSPFSAPYSSALLFRTCSVRSSFPGIFSLWHTFLI